MWRLLSLESCLLVRLWVGRWQPWHSSDSSELLKGKKAGEIPWIVKIKTLHDRNNLWDCPESGAQDLVPFEIGSSLQGVWSGSGGKHPNLTGPQLLRALGRPPVGILVHDDGLNIPPSRCRRKRYVLQDWSSGSCLFPKPLSQFPRPAKCKVF